MKDIKILDTKESLEENKRQERDIVILEAIEREEKPIEYEEFFNL